MAAPAVDGFESFRANARFYAPFQVTRQLRSIACAPSLALLVDVDALERSVLARVDRVMALALDALSKTNVQVVLVGHAPQLQRAVTGAWCVEHAAVLARVRGELPGVPLIVISDEGGLLGEADRAIRLCDEEAGIRATLWWLVDARSRPAP